MSKQALTLKFILSKNRIVGAYAPTTSVEQPYTCGCERLWPFAMRMTVMIWRTALKLKCKFAKFGMSNY